MNRKEVIEWADDFFKSPKAIELLGKTLKKDTYTREEVAELINFGISNVCAFLIESLDKQGVFDHASA